jgi:hypothetical protein
MTNWSARMVDDMQYDKPTIDFYEPPKYAGWWVLGSNVHIHIIEKPTDEQIKNTEQMFGWKWRDEV